MAIQQKLHTKLVQKLILTPSLQQAIKLLPMSTLELGELLTQEMVENPMLEEVPAEDLQAAEAAAPGEARGAAQGTEDRRVGRPGLRVLLRRLPRRRLPAPGAAGDQGTAADREHPLDLDVALRPPALAALDPDRRRRAARDRHGDRRQPRRRRLPGRVGGRDRVDGELGGRRRRARAQARAGLRPDRRGGARPAGVPLAAAAAPRPRGDADREDRHRAPAPAAEPPGAGTGAQARACRSRS